MLPYKRKLIGTRRSFMKTVFIRRAGAAAVVSIFAFLLSACVDNDPANSPAGPGVENPAAARLNSIEPAVGGPAGNGGGVSGGAASGAVSH